MARPWTPAAMMTMSYWRFKSWLRHIRSTAMIAPLQLSRECDALPQSEGVDERQSVDRARGADVFCVEHQDTSADAASDQQGVPERERMAALQGSGFGPEHRLRVNDFGCRRLNVHQRLPG